jgi:hypothetical protein
MITILPEERWEELREIFDKYFDSDLPHSGQAFIIADVDDEGQILSFLVLEQMFRIGQVFGNGSNPRPLFKYVENSLSKGVIIGVASEPRYESLFEKYKMHKVQGTMYRRDF